MQYLYVSYGEDVNIAELAKPVAQATGYEGEIQFDPSKPDGSPRKWMSSQRLNQLGWKPQIDLVNGLTKAYGDFCSQRNVSAP